MNTIEELEAPESNREESSQIPRQGDAPSDWIGRIGRTLKLITEVGSAIALTALAVSMLVVAAGRIAFVPMNVLNQVALWSGVWLATVGAAYVQCNNGHVTAGLTIERFLKGPAKVFLIAVRGVLIVGFIGLLLVTGVIQTHAAYVDDARTLDVLRWPIWPSLLAIPVGTFLWLAIYLIKAVNRGPR